MEKNWGDTPSATLIKCSGVAVWMYTQCSPHTPNQKQLSVFRCSGKIASLEI